MTVVAIVDYGMCNLDSVVRAVDECGGMPRIIENPADLATADRIILPGVGAFDEAMRNLRARALDTALSERVLGASVPFLGICLGMQLLADWGCEGDGATGLGWIPGGVRRLVPTHEGERVPHMGWNEVAVAAESPLMVGVSSGKDFYFVHSYHLVAAAQHDIVARTPYCGGFVSVVQRDNVFGVQFHPEKSQRLGLRLLTNFLAL